MTNRTARDVRTGATVVESAFVLSLALLFILGIFEYCRYLFVLQLAENAVREGARYAVVNTQTASTAQVQAVVDSYLAGQGVQLQNYDKTTSIQVFRADPATGSNLGAWTDASFGDGIGVVLTGTYRPALPSFLFMGNTISIQTESVMLSEAN
jgi:Flp pilus assembly protein TadG